jgi:8-oxo-dGTP diphosphatase
MCFGRSLGDKGPHVYRLIGHERHRADDEQEHESKQERILDGRGAACMAEQLVDKPAATHHEGHSNNLRQCRTATVKDHLNLSSRPQDTLAPIWVSAVALVNASRHVLVQKRPPGGAHGGLWEFPGGKLEPAESLEQAAVRELAEELAIAIAPGDLQPVCFASGVTQAGTIARPLTILLFACQAWEGSPEPRAAVSLAWCDPAELATWPMPPLDYPLAAALVKMLGPNAF